jgi:hypothetical protein
MVRTGSEVGQLAQSLEAGLVRHGEVEQKHVRLNLAGQPDSLFAVGGLADHMKIGFRFQQLAQPVPEDGMVVGDQNADFRLALRHE